MSAENIRNFKEAQPHQLGIEGFQERDRRAVTDLLARSLSDKGYDPGAVSALGHAGIVGELLDNYSLGNKIISGDDAYPDSADTLNSLAQVAVRRESIKRPSYTGTTYENRLIIREPYFSDDDRDPRYLDDEYYYADEDYSTERLRDFRRNGASRYFLPGLVEIDEAGKDRLGLAYVPIAVIGAGAAGVLTAQAIASLGFKNVQLLDKTEEVGGIWNFDNVRLGSKNNPFDITFGEVDLPKSSSFSFEPPFVPELSGLQVQDFIYRIADGLHTNPPSQPIYPQRATVREVEAGDLNHLVRMTVDGEKITKQFPIVVYAPGIGKPLPLSREGHMMTTTDKKEAGIRWQQQLTPEKLRALVGKQLIFIGLGNSTAEMLHQIQQFEDETGRSIDYRILTHYPKAALDIPDLAFGGYDPVFRDLNLPDLTKLAGDLEHIGNAYFRAKKTGKIIPGIASWHAENGQCEVFDNSGHKKVLPYDQIYSLIGYRQDPESLSQMSINVLDDYSATGAFDFDGEVQKHPGAVGRERLFPGYFAIGPVVKNRHNPNAIVIPGIQYQLNDLLTSLVVRATEYALAHPDEVAAIRGAEKARQQMASRAPAFGELVLNGLGVQLSRAISGLESFERYSIYELDQSAQDFTKPYRKIVKAEQKTTSR